MFPIGTLGAALDLGNAPDQRDRKSSEHDECNHALRHPPKSQDPRLPVAHQMIEAADPSELVPLRLDERLALLLPNCLRILLLSRVGRPVRGRGGRVWRSPPKPLPVDVAQQMTRDGSDSAKCNQLTGTTQDLLDSHC